MTDQDLADDLTRLLSDGLVYVYQAGDGAPLRLALTAKGRDVSSAERIFRAETADGDAGPVRVSR
jgi:hypothetical protein